jgi:hypothetical protein
MEYQYNKIDFIIYRTDDAHAHKDIDRLCDGTEHEIVKTPWIKGAEVSSHPKYAYKHLISYS